MIHLVYTYVPTYMHIGLYYIGLYYLSTYVETLPVFNGYCEHNTAKIANNLQLR